MQKDRKASASRVNRNQKGRGVWGQVFDWVAGAAFTVSTAVGGLLISMHRKQNNDAIRIALIEQRMSQIPDLLGEIKTEIQGMREDGRAQASELREDAQNRSHELYRHIDGLRLEFKGDLAGKQDR